MALLRIYSSRNKSCVRESPTFPASVRAERNKHNANEITCFSYSHAAHKNSPLTEPERLLFTSDVSTSTEGFSTSSFDNNNVSLIVIFPFLELKNKYQQT